LAGKALTVLLAAGGTGGHLFPAEALAHELKRRGHAVHLATDGRAERYAAKFPADGVHVVRSATFGSRNPLALLRSLWLLGTGFLQASRLVRRLKPDAAIGFGGYPTLPPMQAALAQGVPAMIHDANAVMGRANRHLAPRVKLVAMGFEAAGNGRNVVVTGNPVRPAIIEAAKVAYPARAAGEPFRLLVFGGSQGAQYFSQALPAAVELIDPGKRSMLDVVQQARPEDEAQVREAYAALGVKAEIAPFFSDMADRLARAHLVVSRAGASTVSELAVIGRPAILVPYPHALDHDQKMNAKAMADAGGARIELQKDLTPERLARMISEAIADPAGLARAAEKARKTGRPDAAARLAVCVEKLAAGEAAAVLAGGNAA